MGKTLLYPVGTTAACRYAAGFLERAGWGILDHPAPEVTHLLLDVPSFQADGTLRGGGDPGHLLSMLPQNITVLGGNLEHPALEGYRKLDLLQDEAYLAQNAAITADCALRIAMKELKTTFPDTPTLVIGWGRIGKCLAQRLRALGSEVTVAARNVRDRAMAEALGYRAVDLPQMAEILPEARLIYNTVPEAMLGSCQLAHCGDCVKIDLASRQGLEGNDVVWARGLPGIHTPESSGRCIARRILQLQREGML